MRPRKDFSWENRSADSLISSEDFEMLILYDRLKPVSATETLDIRVGYYYIDQTSALLKIRLWSEDTSLVLSVDKDDELYLTDLSTIWTPTLNKKLRRFGVVHTKNLKVQTPLTFKYNYDSIEILEITKPDFEIFQG